MKASHPLRASVLCCGAALCGAASAQPSAPQLVVTPQQFGGAGDFRDLAGLRLLAGETTLTGTPGMFSAQDAGRTIFVFGAGSTGSQNALISKVVQVGADGSTARLQESSGRSVDHATGGIGTDNAAALQSCWDASSARGLTCYMQGGRYLYAQSSLTLRRHMRAEGSTPEQTSLVCAPSQRDCVLLDSGPVQFVGLENFELAGTEGALPPPARNDAAQHAFVLRAHGDAGGAGGGLWQSNFRHIQVSNFWGDELALYGGTQDLQHPNQFLSFEDLELQTARGDAEARPPADSYRLKLVGQNAQVHFTGGQIHGTLVGQFGQGVLIDGAGVIQFEGVTCEWLDRCLQVQKGATISFTHGWVENVKDVVELGPGPVNGVFFDQNYLANSCFDLKTHSGFCLHALSAATQDVSFSQNVIASGTAPPDAVLQASPGVTVASSYNDMNGTVANGTARPVSAGVVQDSSRTESPRWQQAKGVSPWIAAGQSTDMTVSWSPGPFATANLQASCVTDGSFGISVVGIRSLTRQDAHVLLQNRDLWKASRATILCTARQVRPDDTQGQNNAH